MAIELVSGFLKLHERVLAGAVQSAPMFIKGSSIILIQAYSSGSRVWMNSDLYHFMTVTESPDDILQAIRASYQQARG